jgi:hypothetical protein
MIKRAGTYLRQHHLGALALVIALSGTAYASSLPHNSVGSSQVRNHSLLVRDMHAGVLPFWAVIRADGARLAGRGILSSGHNAADVYELRVPHRNVARCAFLATLDDESVSNDTTIRAHVAGVGEPGDFVVEVTGSDGTTLKDAPFSVAVIC